MTGIGVMDYGEAAGEGKLGTNVSQNSTTSQRVGGFEHGRERDGGHDKDYGHDGGGGHDKYGWHDGDGYHDYGQR